MKKIKYLLLSSLLMICMIPKAHAGVTDPANVERETKTNYFTKIVVNGVLKDSKTGEEKTNDKETEEIAGNYNDKNVKSEIDKQTKDIINWALDNGAIVITTEKSEVADYYYDAHDEITAANVCGSINEDCDPGPIKITTILDKHQTYEIKVVGEITDLKFTKGINGKFTLDTKNSLSFTLNSYYNLFKNGGKVYINGEVLSSKNYSSKSGSTIVTLNNSYLNNLKDGKYTIKVELSNGKSASTSFTVLKSEKEEEPVVEEPEPIEDEPILEEDSDVTTVGATENTPVNSGNNHTVIYVIVGIVVIILLVVFFIIKKRKKK